MWLYAYAFCSPMNAFRCAGLLLVVMLGGCDKPQEPVIPKPKTQASQSAVPAVEPAPAMPEAPVVQSTVEKPVADVVTGGGVDKPAAPVHELTPNVPVVPVVIGKGESTVAVKPVQVVPDKERKVVKAPARTDVKKTPAEKPPVRREAQVRKADKPGTAAKDVRLGKSRLDLSLPPELVKELVPPPGVITARRKPLLPPMFNDKPVTEESFELNGRLLSNEMQLQMRNDSRRDVEGAALDFKFKQ